MTDQTTGRVDPERWVEDYGDLLFNFAVGRVRNHHVAEDLVQETLTAACKGKERYEGRASEKSWLVSILKNKIVDYQRKLGREQPFTDLEFLKDDMADRFDEDRHWLSDDHPSPQAWGNKPVDAIEQKEFWAAFHECVGKMPAKVSSVFVMREVDGEKSEAICENLSISKANLWVMLHRARLALRECLERNWFLK